MIKKNKLTFLIIMFVMKIIPLYFIRNKPLTRKDLVISLLILLLYVSVIDFNPITFYFVDFPRDIDAGRVTIKSLIKSMV